MAKASRTFDDIKDVIDKAYGNQAFSPGHVRKLIGLVKAGEETKPDTSTRKRKRIRTDILIADVKKFIDKDRRVGIQTIADKFHIGYQTASMILHDDLGLSKLSARWVPKLLIDAHKQRRVECATSIPHRVQ